MLSNSIEITLIASKKVGVLPLLMQKLSSIGLIYRRCVTTEYDDAVKLLLFCEGESDLDRDFIINSLISVPNIDSVISFAESESGLSEVYETLSTRFQESTELHPLRAKDEVTHDVIHIVEDRLAEVFGPVANVLLRSASKKSKLVGALFLNLAENLDEEQKILFLRNIEGLDDMTISSHEAY